MECPKVSIIIPSYNRVDCIDGAIESVLSQDHQNKELIIVDGDSTDGTVEKIRSYAQKYSCVNWVSEKDEGVYDAMNKGIVMSQGEWVYFLGTDDTLYEANVISRVLSSVDSDCQVVYGNVVSTRFESAYDGEFDLEKILRKNICHQAIFFRRKLFESLGVFALKYKVMSDYEFNLKWMLHPDIKYKYVDIVVANYGDKGISSAYPMEAAFGRDFSELILRYGKKTLPGRILRQHLFKACNDLVDQGQPLKSLALFAENLFLLRARSGYCALMYFKHLLKYATIAAFIRARRLMGLR